MKILYAVQATGNGHISRATEILPYLQKYGTVDIMLSGNNADLPVNLPVKYRSNGVSLFYGGGGLNYRKIISQFNPFSIWRDIKNLPVDDYDLIVNDFDFITSIACQIKGVFSVQFGHQASFKYSATPRPQIRNRIGEWVLSNFCKCSTYIGLHFRSYDPMILLPIIKKEIREASNSATNQGHITVYLSQFIPEELILHFKTLVNIKFQIFSQHCKVVTHLDNITLYPLGQESFTHSMIHCNGMITGGGFETPAEALFLGKKLMLIPINGQYEQLCNAEAAKEFGALVVTELTMHFGATVEKFFYPKSNHIQRINSQFSNKNKWTNIKDPINTQTITRDFRSIQIKSNEEIVDNFMQIALMAKKRFNEKKSIKTNSGNYPLIGAHENTFSAGISGSH